MSLYHSLHCSAYGCDLEVFPNARGEGFHCPIHGLITGVCALETIDLRACQALLEILDLVDEGRRHIWH